VYIGISQQKLGLHTVVRIRT